MAAIDTRELEKQLCARVRDLAARGAPMAVKVSSAGSTDLVKANTLTLVVHASVKVVARQRTVVFTVRPVRPSLDATEILYGAAPRATVIGAASISSPQLDAELSAALAEVLPWQQPSGLDARPL